MSTGFHRPILAPLAGAARRGAGALLARLGAARDRRRYEAMSDAELAVHDLDRADIARHIRRRYGDLAPS